MSKTVKKNKRFTAGLLCLVVVGVFIAYGCEKPSEPQEGGEDSSVVIKEPCSCIMDTLRGEWSWVKRRCGFIDLTDNDFKSVLKIVSQNEDASINYEIFVEDTLFYKGSFQVMENYFSYCHQTDIVLPYNWGDGAVNGRWCMSYHEKFQLTKEETIEEILCFMDNRFEGCCYLYKKVK